MVVIEVDGGRRWWRRRPVVVLVQWRNPNLSRLITLSPHLHCRCRGSLVQASGFPTHVATSGHLDRGKTTLTAAITKGGDNVGLLLRGIGRNDIQREQLQPRRRFSYYAIIDDPGESSGEKSPPRRTEEEFRTEFELWMARYEKTYNSLEEKERRFQIFKDLLTFIDEHNSSGKRSYKVGLNHFSDATDEEFYSMYVNPYVYDMSTDEAKKPKTDGENRKPS